MADDKSRNPMIIPAEKPVDKRDPGCPKCKSENLDFFMSYGVATTRCKDCGNLFHSGIGMSPRDPREPNPPENPRDRPTTDFQYNPRSKEVEEFRVHPSDPTQSFRRGLPVGGDDE